MMAGADPADLAAGIAVAALVCRPGLVPSRPLVAAPGRPARLPDVPRGFWWAAVLGALTVKSPTVAIVWAVLPWIVRRVRRRTRARAETSAMIRDLPLVIDLVLLGVDAGLSARRSVAVVVAWMPASIRPVFVDALRRADDGVPFARALDTAVAAARSTLGPLAGVLAAAEIDGAPPGAALRRLGDDARRRRFLDAQQRARRLPVLMVFPLVLCVLPAFVLVSLVPLLVGVVGDLGL